MHVLTELRERDGEEEENEEAHRDARKAPEEKPRPSETSVSLGFMRGRTNTDRAPLAPSGRRRGRNHLVGET